MATIPLLSADPAFDALKRWVADTTGMSFLLSRDDTVGHAVQQRMQVHGLTSVARYLHWLDSADGSEEAQDLIAELTIGETYFFRFRAQWTAFVERIIPDILDRNRTLRRLHLWCAGCSTGPEPYTAAILLQEQFQHRLEGWDLRILGTDINRQFLHLARQARYSDWAFRATPDEVRTRCFTRVGRSWELRPAYRQVVTFQQHNLVRGAFPPDPALMPDLIFCRNVFIYFDGATNRRVIRQFRDILADDGWLLVGHAESDLSLFDGFDCLALADTTLYRKSSHAPDRRRREQPRPVLARPGPAPARPVLPKAGSPTRSAAPAVARPPVQPAAEPTLPESVDGTDRYRLVLHQLAAEADGDAARLALDWLAEDQMNPWPHLALAAVHSHRGEDDKAERSLRDALYLDRAFLLAHYELGCRLARRGAGDEARRSFRTVQSLCLRLGPAAPVPGAAPLTAGDLDSAAALQLNRLSPP